MSEKLSPDEAFRELSLFLEVIAETQEKYHGITSNFTGDGTLALFNAPEEDQKHQENACFAALDALETLAKLNEQRRNEGKFEFKARIGINTAEVLLGNLGTSERFAYTAIGDGVNLASRLEGLGKIYGIEILVGKDCYEAVGDSLEWRLLDKISVVGRDSSTLVYQPLGRKGQVARPFLEARDSYEIALREYFQGNFETALYEFQRSLSLWPDHHDPPTKLMIQRVKTLVRKGPAPPSDWDGVYAVRTK